MRPHMNIDHLEQKKYRDSLGLICEFLHLQDGWEELDGEIKNTQDYTLFEFQQRISEQIKNGI